MISVIGIPTDRHSSFLKGAALAPPLIIKEFHSDAGNKFAENGLDLGKEGLWEDIGLIKLMDSDNEFDKIKDSIEDVLNNRNYPISIGGDHSITYPIIAGYHKFYPKVNILHFDAHPDLYENFENDPFSHASPFARIMENNLANELIQIGIRTMTDHQKDQVDKYKIKVITMNEFASDLVLKFDDPVYISIDLDGLDPAYAPGVSHPEPGGLSTRDMLKIISNIDGEVIGGDIVEYNPKKDINNITAVTAAKLLKELMGKILK